MNPAARPLTLAASRPRVLVIDDDVALCTALTVALEDDFTVAVATSGPAGLVCLQDMPIALVLLLQSSAL